MIVGLFASVFLTVLAMLPGLPFSDAARTIAPVFTTALATFGVVLVTIRDAGGWKRVGKLRVALVGLLSALIIGVGSHLSALLGVVLFYYLP
ncbi:hypothetical protein DYGSA30_14640 [Dyella sp. GSA-30]|nr:hypothetical protein DYGSA30_14640 [Dyella sp. GSA-30]